MQGGGRPDFRRRFRDNENLFDWIGIVSTGGQSRRYHDTRVKKGFTCLDDAAGMMIILILTVESSKGYEAAEKRCFETVLRFLVKATEPWDAELGHGLVGYWDRPGR